MIVIISALIYMFLDFMYLFFQQTDIVELLYNFYAIVLLESRFYTYVY